MLKLLWGSCPLDTPMSLMLSCYFLCRRGGPPRGRPGPYWERFLPTEDTLYFYLVTCAGGRWPGRKTRDYTAVLAAQKRAWRRRLHCDVSPPLVACFVLRWTKRSFFTRCLAINIFDFIVVRGGFWLAAQRQFSRIVTGVSLGFPFQRGVLVICFVIVKTHHSSVQTPTFSGIMTELT